MSTRQRSWALPVVICAAFLAAVPTAAHADAGPLTWIGCISDEEINSAPDCNETARGMTNAAYSAVSPDGRNVYVSARFADAIAVFNRNRTTGELTQLKGQQGCISNEANPVEGCSLTPALDSPGAIAISQDGNFVYATGTASYSIVVFRRDSKSGALTEAGCYVADGTGTMIWPSCQATTALRSPIGLVLSPGGENLYVASSGLSAILAFSRNPETGALTELACTARTTGVGCSTTQSALNETTWVTVSSDGRNVYAAARLSSAVVTFSRDPATGVLTPMGCVSGNDGYRQEPGCEAGHGLEYVQTVAVSPDGLDLYASATDSHTVASFRRDPATGMLTQSGCVSDFTDGAGTCEGAAGLSLPLGIAITPDGEDVYTGSFGYGSVASFERDAATGLITQYGPCFSLSDPDCGEPVPGLDRAGFATLSPDSRHLYVNAPNSSTISTFSRTSSSTAPAIETARARAGGRGIPISLTCPPTADGGCIGHLAITVPRGPAAGVAFKHPAYDLLAGAGGTVKVAPKRKDEKLPKHFKALVVAAGNLPGDQVIGQSRYVVVTAP